MVYKRSRRSYKKDKKRHKYKQVAMLNFRSIITFKYYLKIILEKSSIDEDFASAFTANLITKGTRGSLEEARDYVRETANQGVIDGPTCDEICRLLDRYSKYR